MDFNDRRTGQVTDGAFKSMADVQKAHQAQGGHFFDADSKRFFRSKVGNTLHSGPGGHYFTTSEQFHDHMTGHTDPRTYSVRQAHPDGSIKTVGEFGGHPNRGSATSMAKKLAQRRG